MLRSVNRQQHTHLYRGRNARLKELQGLRLHPPDETRFLRKGYARSSRCGIARTRRPRTGAGLQPSRDLQKMLTCAGGVVARGRVNAPATEFSDGVEPGYP